MSQKYDFEPLKDERVDFSLRPHPLSFFRYYVATIYLALLAIGLLKFYGYIMSNPIVLNLLDALRNIISWLSPEILLLLIVFWAALILSGLLIGVLWVSKMPLIYIILIGIVGTLLEIYPITPFNLISTPKPILTLIVSSIIGFFLVEGYRRGHKYFITSYRIITIKKFISKEVREIMYDKLADIYVDQGLLGRIFNYGTVIPVSESGFGLGEDAALASILAAAPVKRGFLGVSFGGKRGVVRPRAATYFSLYGVSNPRRICGIIGDRLLETKEAPILRRIENILEERGKEKRERDWRRRRANNNGF